MSDETAGEKQGEDKSRGRGRIDRARLARIFGDVLPDTTRDERSPGEDRSSESDEWIRRQVPPHHGKV